MTDTRPDEQPLGAGPLERELSEAASLLSRATSVLLLAHNHPDADSLGSALALGVALTRRGTRARVSFAQPAEVPASLRELPGQDLVVPADTVAGALADVDLLVSLDAGSAERLGRLAELFGAGVPLLVIDHHASNTRFGDFHLIDPAADATVVLVEHVLQRLDVPLDADLAGLLYVGLATDTGGFRHGSAAGHELAARLIRAGARPTELLRPITDSHPFGWMGMLSAVLGRAELIPSAVGGRGLVHTSVRAADLQGLRQEEADSVIDILRTTTQAQVAAVFKQEDQDRWQVSLRSHGDVKVGDAAVALGGGGHPRAAGFSWRGDHAGAIDALLGALHATQP